MNHPKKIINEWIYLHASFQFIIFIAKWNFPGKKWTNNWKLNNKKSKESMTYTVSLNIICRKKLNADSINVMWVPFFAVASCSFILLFYHAIQIALMTSLNWLAFSPISFLHSKPSANRSPWVYRNVCTSHTCEHLNSVVAVEASFVVENQSPQLWKKNGFST